MANTFIEKRLVDEGVKLCEKRIDQIGTEITVDDIKSLKIKTFSPVLQSVYVGLGTLLFVFGIWFQFENGNMAVSMGLVMIGFLNVAYGIQGRPKPAVSLSGLDYVELTAEIIRTFTEKQNQSRE